MINNLEDDVHSDKSYTLFDTITKKSELNQKQNSIPLPVTIEALSKNIQELNVNKTLQHGIAAHKEGNFKEAE
ncbi:MAG: hypothetical protein ACKVHI_12490, partial [Candidatus Puniceispirillales bacterium]